MKTVLFFLITVKLALWKLTAFGVGWAEKGKKGNIGITVIQ